MSTLLPDVWSLEPSGLIALRLTKTEWQELLLVLGYKVGVSMRLGDQPMQDRAIRLVNRLNTGNPAFTPYERE